MFSWLNKCFRFIFDWMLLASVLLLSYMIFISSSGVRLYRQLGAAQKEQAQQLAHLKERVATLTFQKEALLSDPMYLEYGVRTQWEMVKPGETVLWYQDL